MKNPQITPIYAEKIYVPLRNLQTKGSRLNPTNIGRTRRQRDQLLILVCKACQNPINKRRLRQSNRNGEAKSGRRICRDETNDDHENCNSKF